MYHKFARVHKTLGMTLAMATGISDHVSTIEEILSLKNFKNCLIQTRPLPFIDKKKDL